MNKTVLITGANGGIGKETALQIGLLKETEKVILACRNMDRALAAKKELEEATNRKIFEIVIIDLGSFESIQKAVDSLSEPIDAVILNAGGMAGRNPEKIVESGVTTIFSLNVMGHVSLLEELINKSLIKNVVVFAGSETARGVASMGIKKPDLKSHSEEEFNAIMDGSFYGDKFDAMKAYGSAKYIGILWMSALARKHTGIKFVSVSPGSTKGTQATDHLPAFQRFFMKHVAMNILLPLFGMAHSPEKAAHRYVEGISSTSFETGKFYASSKKKLTGKLVDQSPLSSDLTNAQFQDNAYNALQKKYKNLKS